MKFSKYHALGNDYLVLDPKDAPELPGTDDTIRICHRNFGLGSDGILYGPIPTERADFGLRIINPDGSEAEKAATVYASSRATSSMRARLAPNHLQ